MLNNKKLEGLIGLLLCFCTSMSLFMDFVCPADLASSADGNAILIVLDNLYLSIGSDAFAICICFVAFLWLRRQFPAERKNFLLRIICLAVACVWLMGQCFGIDNSLDELSKGPGQLVKALVYLLGSYNLLMQLTQDIWGTQTAAYSPERDIEKIRDTVLSFKGEQIQLPPMYSAIKINGVRLYDLAREGKNVPRDARKINVLDISFLGKTENEDEYKFSVHCSKGTYVRTLCADMGAALSCGGTMTSLVRTQALGFELSECVSLEDVQRAADDGWADQLIRPIQELFDDLPPIYLDEAQAKKFKNGAGLDPRKVSGVIYDTAFVIADWQKYSVFGCDKVFLGIGKVEYPQRIFKCQKLFNIED